jgi:hypothetical protein
MGVGGIKCLGKVCISQTDQFMGSYAYPVKQWQARQKSKDLSKVTIRGLLSKSDTGCWILNLSNQS